MTDKITPLRALKIIEGLCLAIDGSGTRDKTTSTIYQIAHVGIGRCKNKHPDWVSSALKLEEDLKDGCII